MPDSEAREFKFKDRNGDHSIKIWCEGRDYDPGTESYHARYAYQIVTPDWTYDGNDLRGIRDGVPNLRAASQSLLAFLYACQESYNRSGRLARSENADLFPEHVREWAHYFSEEIAVIYDIVFEEACGTQG